MRSGSVQKRNAQRKGDGATSMANGYLLYRDFADGRSHVAVPASFDPIGGWTIGADKMTEADEIGEAFLCIVVGSRNVSDGFYPILASHLDALLVNASKRFKDGVIVVSGGAKGIDRMAERYAAERGYRLAVFPADWDAYGKRAGYIRNRAMHEFAVRCDRAPDGSGRGCVAFWDGVSRGTAQSFSLAKEMGTPLRVVRIDGRHR